MDEEVAFLCQAILFSTKQNEKHWVIIAVCRDTEQRQALFFCFFQGKGIKTSSSLDLAYVIKEDRRSKNKDNFSDFSFVSSFFVVKFHFSVDGVLTIFFAS